MWADLRVAPSPKASVSRSACSDRRYRPLDGGLRFNSASRCAITPIGLTRWSPIERAIARPGSVISASSRANVTPANSGLSESAAKSGLTCYLEGLRSRLYKRGVRVHNLKLGPVATPMSEGHPQNMLWGEKRQVAGAIVRALGRRRHVVYAPRSWRLVMAIVRCLPECVFQRFGFLAGR